MPKTTEWFDKIYKAMKQSPNSELRTPTQPKLKVALVADWLVGFGGAERVVHELHKMFPEAPIYTSVFDPENAPAFKGADVRTSFIQKLPYFNKHHRLVPLLRRKAFERFDFSEYDLIISSSGAEAKGILTNKLRTPIRQPADQTPSERSPVHVNYCHAPTHYYWSRYKEYLRNPAIGLIDPIAKWYLKQTINRSRGWDYLAAQRPDYMLANSTHIQKEIKKYYNRESTVIHPPVDIARFTPPVGGPSSNGQTNREGLLAVGRQIHYKRIDLAVKACSELDIPLTVIGDGPMHQRLRAMAGSKVTFIQSASDEEVAEHMANAEALIFPGLDDFGITPVEAMACGTPVIAYGAGGALDTVTDKTGLLFSEPTAPSLAQALSQFEAKNYNPKAIREHARKFSVDTFQRQMRNFVQTALEEN